MSDSLDNTDNLAALAEQEISDRPQQREKSQATRLVELCSDIILFHSPEDEPYATIQVSDHSEHWAIRSETFRKWLHREFYLRFKTAVGSQAMQDALGALGARAQFDGEEHPVFLRIAKHQGRVYVDLANKDWEVVEIAPEGWRIIKDVPVRFTRAKRMQPLPQPIRTKEHGSIEELRSFLNVDSDSEDAFRLIVAWVINAYNPDGPYLVLVLYGEQGSAKSSTVRAIRDLIDPNLVPLRREPRDSDDLMVSTKANWILAIDNMSHLPDWLSDDLCRVATGGGISKRAHYTNDEEFVLNAKRPVILNGIDEFVARGDLASRAITLFLPPLSPDDRKRETNLWADYERARPRILGAIFDAISGALRNSDTFELERAPRMADAWHWITAAETALDWKRGSALDAFYANQTSSNETVLHSSMIAPYIRQLSLNDWSGTPSDLLSKLNSMVPAGVSLGPSWPRDARVLSNRIRRINPALRDAGVEITFSRTPGSNSERIVTIRRTPHSSVAKVATANPVRDGGVEHVGDDGDAESHQDSCDGNQDQGQLTLFKAEDVLQ